MLGRSLTYNMVMGTSVGFTKVLTLIGVGYRASLADNVLTLNLGFSHPVVIPVPQGITVVVRPSCPPSTPPSEGLRREPSRSGAL